MWCPSYWMAPAKRNRAGTPDFFSFKYRCTVVVCVCWESKSLQRKRFSLLVSQQIGEFSWSTLAFKASFPWNVNLPLTCQFSIIKSWSWSTHPLKSPHIKAAFFSHLRGSYTNWDDIHTPPYCVPAIVLSKSHSLKTKSRSVTFTGSHIITTFPRTASRYPGR